MTARGEAEPFLSAAAWEAGRAEFCQAKRAGDAGGVVRAARRLRRLELDAGTPRERLAEWLRSAAESE
ncbi:MAG TPA: hypothetical protein VFS43_13275 [Polyangiaceae bacterium]|nr:hypothetical protein [Polyangiaceae bacterium]